MSAIFGFVFNRSFYGNKLNIESYEDNMVSLINTDGVKFFVQVSPYLEAVKNYIGTSKWMECRAVCRNVKNEAMWALLAGSAVSAKQLDTAEECFLAIGQIERAMFIQHIKALTFFSSFFFFGPHPLIYTKYLVDFIKLTRCTPKLFCNTFYIKCSQHYDIVGYIFYDIIYLYLILSYDRKLFLVFRVVFRQYPTERFKTRRLLYSLGKYRKQNRFCSKTDTHTKLSCLTYKYITGVGTYLSQFLNSKQFFITHIRIYYNMIKLKYLKS